VLRPLQQLQHKDLDQAAITRRLALLSDYDLIFSSVNPTSFFPSELVSTSSTTLQHCTQSKNILTNVIEKQLSSLRSTPSTSCAADYSRSQSLPSTTRKSVGKRSHSSYLTWRSESPNSKRNFNVNET
jgi:hypothetical protein